MALDIGAIDAAKEELDKRGSGDLIKVSDLPDKGEMDIRILPPTASLGKFYYLKTVDLKLGKDGGWVKSLMTFGDGNCPVMKIWKEAKESDDPEVVKRAKEIQEKPSFFMPILALTTDAKGNVKEAKMGCCSAKATVISAISGFFADGKYGNGTDNLLADRARGRNFTIKRTGTTQFNTKYTVQPWPSETSFEESQYDEAYNNTVDVAEVYKAMMGDISTQVDIITNYLYGKPSNKAGKKDVEDE